MKSAARLALLASAVLLNACGWTEPKNSIEDQLAERQKALAQRLKAVCSSPATYDRLKQVAFDEAIRIRNADPVNLDLLSTHALVRMENPVVKSRDEALDITVCSGRLILHVPPGAEKAFEGRRQLAADVEYAAQAAADGSGLVFQIQGAEPIIYRLAAFDLREQAYRPVRQARATSPAEHPEVAAPAPARSQQPTPRPMADREPRVAARSAADARPAASPATRQQATPAPAHSSASPSFNCRYGKSRSEQMVCNSARLATLDRAMSSQFYAELDRADQRTRARLRQTRDRFLGDREQCGDEECVARVYQQRMNEIQAIADE